jgi:hypothetical protein
MSARFENALVRAQKSIDDALAALAWTNTDGVIGGTTTDFVRPLIDAQGNLHAARERYLARERAGQGGARALRAGPGERGLNRTRADRPTQAA